MSRESKKIKLVAILIALIVALAPILVWIVKLESERNLAEVYIPFGSVEEIIASILIVAIFIAIIIVAVSLQKVIDDIVPGMVDFPTLNTQQRINTNNATNYFNRPPPRQLDEPIFSAIWNGLLPSPVRILLWSLLPLMLALMGLIIFVAMTMTVDDRSLDKGPTEQVEATIISSIRKNTRSGTYYEVDYQYKPRQFEFKLNSHSIKGRSYADHSQFDVGAVVKVEYLANTPNISRIVGLRTSAFDITMFIVIIVLINLIIIPGLLIFLWWRKGFAKVLVIQGVMLEGQLEKVKKGGKGTVFARVSFVLNGIRQSKKLICPATPELFAVLSNRQKENLPVKLLVHPSRYRYAYLLEPHLSS